MKIFITGLGFLAAAFMSVTPAHAATPQMSIGSKFADGQCLETRADGSLIINKCNAQGTQLLRYDDATGRLHQGDQCLSAATRGQPLVAKACGEGDDQKWSFAEDATLRSDSGLCADILNFRKDAGTAVIAWDCTATDNQKFFATNVKVTAPAPQQVVAAIPPINGQPVLATYYVQGRCLNVTGRSTVTIDVCERRPAQDFRFRSGASGQIVQGDKCLASSVKGEPLVVKACANVPEQDWTLTGEGTLRNRVDVCADIFAFLTRNGTDVIAWDCTGTDNQKFYPAIAAESGSFSLGEALAKQLSGADGKVTTVSMVGGYSAYNLTGSGGRTISVDAKGRITGGEGGTLVVGGAGVLTVRFVNGLAAPGIKAEHAAATNILPKEWSFFSGDTAGTLMVK
ncbi:ricin-type beta-trefoil lectin domain protein [Asticcacaulis machinosus]|uniref:Ricin-type beta-trefoil lectin domain protein n=1 Tax=Asticcacaulis machinosus TaxID=2984211 RepID=A0ABT5HNJ5_9CAUL|nr:ricin-type beta-trefoil lectin domain protein [Asticcacaulis machinosus]MDC7677792.1 ricin-type beta-trefoil lectin domain protein [Asticcacaulis machinosus]